MTLSIVNESVRADFYRAEPILENSGKAVPEQAKAPTSEAHFLQSGGPVPLPKPNALLTKNSAENLSSFFEMLDSLDLDSYSADEARGTTTGFVQRDGNTSGDGSGQDGGNSDKSAELYTIMLTLLLETVKSQRLKVTIDFIESLKITYKIDMDENVKALKESAEMLKEAAKAGEIGTIFSWIGVVATVLLAIAGAVFSGGSSLALIGAAVGMVSALISVVEMVPVNEEGQGALSALITEIAVAAGASREDALVIGQWVSVGIQVLLAITGIGVAMMASKAASVGTKVATEAAEEASKAVAKAAAEVVEETSTAAAKAAAEVAKEASKTVAKATAEIVEGASTAGAKAVTEGVEETSKAAVRAATEAAEKSSKAAARAVAEVVEDASTAGAKAVTEGVEEASKAAVEAATEVAEKSSKAVAEGVEEASKVGLKSTADATDDILESGMMAFTAKKVASRATVGINVVNSVTELGGTATGGVVAALDYKAKQASAEALVAEAGTERTVADMNVNRRLVGQIIKQINEIIASLSETQQDIAAINESIISRMGKRV